jgi:hypothetical protein
MASGPQLNWGLLAALDLARATQVPTALARTWQLAQQSLGIVVQPIERFELAGTLNGHPGHVRSDQAKRPFGAIFAHAVASRTAAEPLRSESLQTAAAALLAWARVYPPIGNPIDEWFFVPLLQAADLVSPDLDAADRRDLLGWVSEFDRAAAGFYEQRGTARAVGLSPPGRPPA